MANSAQSIYKHYIRALRYWPKDILRPEVSFQGVIKERLDTRFLGRSPEESKDSNKDSDKQAPISSLPPEIENLQDGAVKGLNVKTEMAQVNALYSLLENRYNQKFPITQAFMQPLSNPSHYYDLLAELEAAPQRSWWERLVSGLKGKVRFS